MRRFVLIQLLCLFLVLCFQLPDAAAVGLGMYGTTGSGSSDWEELDWFSSGLLDFSADTDHKGFGLVVDTAVSTDRVFNYRLNVGYEKIDHNPDSGSSPYEYELDAIVMSHDFGFGIVRTNAVRLWLGPEIAISYASGEPKGVSGVDVEMWGFGVGPVLGLNFQVTDTVALAFKGGLRVTQYYANIDDSSGLIDQDFEVDESHGYMNFSVIFKIDEY